MKNLSSLIVLCAFFGGTAQAHPPSQEPNSIEQTIVVNCGLRKAAVSYELGIEGKSESGIALTAINVAATEQAPRMELALSDLPSEVSRLKKPFVQRVIPSCLEGDTVLFTFYVVPTADVVLPYYTSSGVVQRLYLKIGGNGEIETWSRPLPKL